jgi:hypothetical protein
MDVCYALYDTVIEVDVATIVLHFDAPRYAIYELRCNAKKKKKKKKLAIEQCFTLR